MNFNLLHKYLLTLLFASVILAWVRAERRESYLEGQWSVYQSFADQADIKPYEGYQKGPTQHVRHR